jgi:hypothetical protein
VRARERREEKSRGEKRREEERKSGTGVIEEMRELEREEEAEGEAGLWSLSSRWALLQEEDK